MDALTSKAREMLEVAGAYPATVDDLAPEIEKWVRDRVARDAKDREAMQALLKGIEAAPEACNCHRSTVYRRAKRAGRKSHFRQHSATSPA